MVGNCPKRSARFGLWYHIYFLQIKPFTGFSLNDQCPVKMLTALRCQKYLSFLKNGIYPFKYRFCSLKA